MNLEDYVKANGPLAPEVALGMFLQLLDELNRARKAGTMLDAVTPSQVQFLGAGKATIDDRWKLSDTVLAGEAADDYKAPELFFGGRASAQSDSYTAACVLWFALTGAAPFAGARSVAMAHLIDPVPVYKGTGLRVHVVNACLEACLAKNDFRRPDSAAGVQDSIDRFLAKLEPGEIGDGPVIEVPDVVVPEPPSPSPQVAAPEPVVAEPVIAPEPASVEPPLPSPQVAAPETVNSGIAASEPSLPNPPFPDTSRSEPSFGKTELGVPYASATEPERTAPDAAEQPSTFGAYEPEPTPALPEPPTVAAPEQVTFAVPEPVVSEPEPWTTWETSVVSATVTEPEPVVEPVLAVESEPTVPEPEPTPEPESRTSFLDSWQPTWDQPQAAAPASHIPTSAISSPDVPAEPSGQPESIDVPDDSPLAFLNGLSLEELKKLVGDTSAGEPVSGAETSSGFDSAAGSSAVDSFGMESGVTGSKSDGMPDYGYSHSPQQTEVSASPADSEPRQYRPAAEPITPNNPAPEPADITMVMKPVGDVDAEVLENARVETPKPEPVSAPAKSEPARAARHAVQEVDKKAKRAEARAAKLEEKARRKAQAEKAEQEVAELKARDAQIRREERQARAAERAQRRAKPESPEPQKAQDEPKYANKFEATEDKVQTEKKAPSKRKRALAGIAAAVLVLAGAGGLLYYTTSMHPSAAVNDPFASDQVDAEDAVEGPENGAYSCDSAKKLGTYLKEQHWDSNQDLPIKTFTTKAGKPCSITFKEGDGPEIKEGDSVVYDFTIYSGEGKVINQDYSHKYQLQSHGNFDAEFNKVLETLHYGSETLVSFTDRNNSGHLVYLKIAVG
ncbi:MAG: hypothetical protein LBR21_04660 [Propionibacteriaceae bacterium]|jgi:hypothetical protein|nr:hypothetical protein [Propionibacteriaceae bacterium]